MIINFLHNSIFVGIKSLGLLHVLSFELGTKQYLYTIRVEAMSNYIEISLRVIFVANLKRNFFPFHYVVLEKINEYFDDDSDRKRTTGIER